MAGRCLSLAEAAEDSLRRSEVEDPGLPWAEPGVGMAQEIELRRSGTGRRVPPLRGSEALGGRLPQIPHRPKSGGAAASGASPCCFCEAQHQAATLQFIRDALPATTVAVMIAACGTLVLFLDVTS